MGAITTLELKWAQWLKQFSYAQLTTMKLTKTVFVSPKIAVHDSLFTMMIASLGGDRVRGYDYIIHHLDFKTLRKLLRIRSPSSCCIVNQMFPRLSWDKQNNGHLSYCSREENRLASYVAAMSRPTMNLDDISCWCFLSIFTEATDKYWAKIKTYHEFRLACL